MESNREMHERRVNEKVRRRRRRRRRRHHRILRTNTKIVGIRKTEQIIDCGIGDFLLF